MDAERIRIFLLQLPHATETLQWGENLVFWIGDRAIGGKIFTIINLGGHGQVIAYAAGPERFSELVEREGIVPAPYLARAFWVGVEHWQIFRHSDWEEELRRAHQIVFEKLPRRTRTLLELPPTERKRALTTHKRSAKKIPTPSKKSATKKKPAKPNATAAKSKAAKKRP